MSKRKYSDHTLKLKAEVLRRLESESGTKLCKEYDLAPSTISTWKRQKEKILAEVNLSVQPTRKRIRLSRVPEVEKALLFWLKDMRSRDNPPPISRKLFMRQADRFAERFNITNWSCNIGFFNRFIRRYAILSKKICGEGMDCPDTTTFREEILLPLLAKYDPEDIYNADETSLYPKLLPGRTYAFKGEKVIGSKWLKSKDRLTLMLCCNMTGSHKLEPLIIGKTKKPQVLKRKYNMTTEDLPVSYYSSKNGWMTGYIFDQWLSKWNRKLLMQNRKVLLLVDNAPSHVVTHYSNIEIQFLPPNTTSQMQPMDQGIIRLVKLAYRCMIADRYLEGITNFEEAKEVVKSFDIKVACDLAVIAWQKVSIDVIQNCYSKAGFLHSVSREFDPEPAPAESTWDSIQTALGVTEEFNDFATADDAVETSEHLTEDDIVEAVTSDNVEHIETEENTVDDDDEEEADPVPPIKSCAEFVKMITQQRSYLQRLKIHTSTLDELEQVVIESNIKRNQCQSKIYNYFK